MTLATLRTSKWVLRTILALAFVVFCLVLAVWQWERSQDELAIERAALAEPIPVGEALTATESTIPLESLGRQVRVVGPVLSDAQTLVRDRTSDTDSAGYWVVVGVEAAPNEVVPVLLGWTPEPELPELTGDLAVTGRLQPDENFYPEAGVNAGQPLLTITKAGLTQLWVTPGGKTPTV
nr:hypothetical protein [Actinomycetes bacterium]